MQKMNQAFNQSLTDTSIGGTVRNSQEIFSLGGQQIIESVLFVIMTAICFFFSGLLLSE